MIVVDENDPIGGAYLQIVSKQKYNSDQGYWKWILTKSLLESLRWEQEILWTDWLYSINVRSYVLHS